VVAIFKIDGVGASAMMLVAAAPVAMAHRSPARALTSK